MRHKWSNSSTKTAQALRELAVPQRFALSGTPIENNLEELWSLFATIMPGFFPTKQIQGTCRRRNCANDSTVYFTAR